MQDIHTVKTLQIDQNLAFERAEWCVPHIAWLVMVAIMLATALGLFGRGVLSRSRIESADGRMQVEYERFVRFGEAVRLTVRGSPAPEGGLQVTLGRSMLEAFRILHVSPPPLSARTGQDGVEYRFAAEGEAAVLFDLEPVRRWRVDSEIPSPAGVIRFWQFVFP